MTDNVASSDVVVPVNKKILITVVGAVSLLTIINKFSYDQRNVCYGTGCINNEGDNIMLTEQIMPLYVLEHSHITTIVFRVRENSRLAKLRKCYSEMIGASLNCLKYLFKGKIVTDDDTPNQLGMEDGDFIEGHLEHVNPPAECCSLQYELQVVVHDI